MVPEYPPTFDDFAIVPTRGGEALLVADGRWLLMRPLAGVEPPELAYRLARGNAAQPG